MGDSIEADIFMRFRSGSGWRRTSNSDTILKVTAIQASKTIHSSE